MRTFWLASATLLRQHFVGVLAVSLVATVVLAFGIPRLEFKTSQDTIVPAGSDVYQDNLRYQRQFGGEPLLVLFTGDDIRDLLTGENARELGALERELNESGMFHAVLGPMTVLEFARDQVPVGAELAPAALVREQDRAAAEAQAEAAAAGASEAEQREAAEAARARAGQEFAERNAAEGLRLGEAGELSLDNPAFVEFLVFEEDGAIRPEFTGVFPDEQHALMVLHLQGNLTIDEQGEAGADAVALVNSYEFDGFGMLPTGPPLLLKEINDTMRESMLRMAVLAVVIMMVLLFAVFRARWRLLSLGIVLVGNVWAFGLMGFLGIPLTMVTISGLPILIGLGVDFAIQLHSRFEEELERTGNADDGLVSALVNLGPALGIAVIAATTGFLVLHISRVPMIQDFGSMLAVGAVILVIADIFLLGALLYARDRRRTAARPATGVAPPMRVERVVRALASSADGGRLLPVVMLGIGFILLGLWAEDHITIQTDPEKFVPQDSPVLQDLYTIRDTAGSSSQLGIMVEADDVTRPDVLAWMDEFTRTQLEQHPRELLRAESVASVTRRVTGTVPTTEDVEAVFAVAPDAIERIFISEDRSRAHIVFAIGPVSLQDRERLLRNMERDMRDTPPGVSATASGLAAIGIEAVHALSANRLLLIYAALGAKFAWFLIIYRNLAKTLLALLPILIAVGGSSAAIFLLGIELNPLTTLSGPLVIAVAVEFSVLIMARYYEERERGLSPREALDMSSKRIGRAITASGLTTIGGFGVLAFSGLPLLESFGIVTAMNVGIALLSTLIILPALLVWTDEETNLVPVREDLRPAE